MLFHSFPLDEDTASRAATVIVFGSDGRDGGKVDTNENDQAIAE